MSKAMQTPGDAGLDSDDLPDGIDEKYARVARRPDAFLGRLEGSGLRHLAYYRPQKRRWDIYRGKTVKGEAVISTQRVTRLDAAGPDGDVPPYDPVLQRFLWKRTAGYTGDEPALLRVFMAFLNALLAAWYTLAGRQFRFQLYRSPRFDPNQNGDNHV